VAGSIAVTYRVASGTNCCHLQLLARLEDIFATAPVKNIAKQRIPGLLGVAVPDGRDRKCKHSGHHRVGGMFATHQARH
jgi:hypothetical protein